MSELLPDILVPVSGQQLSADANQANSLDKSPVNQEFARLLNHKLEHHQVPSGESEHLVSKILQGKDLPFNGRFLPSASLPRQLETKSPDTSGIQASPLPVSSAELPAVMPGGLPVQADLPEIGLPGLSLASIAIDSTPGNTDEIQAGIEQVSQQLDSKGSLPYAVLNQVNLVANQSNQPRASAIPVGIDPVVVSESSVNAPVQNATAQVMVRSILGSQASEVAKDRIADGKIPALANSESTALHHKAIPQAATSRVVLTENLESRFLNNDILPVNTNGNSENTSPLTEKNNTQFNSQLAARLDAMQALPASVTAPSGSGKAATETLARTSPELQMQYSINKPEWGNELSTKITMMTKQEMPSAYIRMNPAHLGPIEVRISMQNEAASVSFVTQNPAVREAIEGAMPKLREMLDNNGLGLADVDVSDHSHTEQRDQAWEQARERADDSRENPNQFNGVEGIEVGNDRAMTYQVTGAVDYFV